VLATCRLPDELDKTTLCLARYLGYLLWSILGGVRSSSTRSDYESRYRLQWGSVTANLFLVPMFHTS